MTSRVLFVDHVGVLGGGELSLLDLVRHFKNTSRVVLFEDGPFRKRLHQAGVAVDVVRAPASLSKIARAGGVNGDLQAVPGVLKLAWKLSRLARGYDVIYANSQKSMIIAALAGRIARRPVIWHLRDLMTTDHFSRVHCRAAVAFSNMFVTRVIANSHATRNAFVEHGGQAERVFSVYNGIDEAPFCTVTTAEVERLREELGLVGVPIVGVFSRLAPWKGQHVLLEALKDLGEVHAVLVGEALFGEDEKYAEMLHQQAKQFGITGRAHFLGFRHDIPQLVHLVDIVVHTSTAPEPFGRVIVEGMLARKPVVATRAGGAVEIIEDGKTGVLVPRGDAGKLTSALANLLAEPDMARAIAYAGQKAARERFCIKNMREEVSSHICQVVAQQPRRATSLRLNGARSVGNVGTLL